jgi:hypothetical protein
VCPDQHSIRRGPEPIVRIRLEFAVAIRVASTDELEVEEAPTGTVQLHIPVRPGRVPSRLGETFRPSAKVPDVELAFTVSRCGEQMDADGILFCRGRIDSDDACGPLYEPHVIGKRAVRRGHEVADMGRVLVFVAHAAMRADDAVEQHEPRPLTERFGPVVQELGPAALCHGDGPQIGHEIGVLVPDVEGRRLECRRG